MNVVMVKGGRKERSGYFRGGEIEKILWTEVSKLVKQLQI